MFSYDVKIVISNGGCNEYLESLKFSPFHILSSKFKTIKSISVRNGIFYTKM